MASSLLRSCCARGPLQVRTRCAQQAGNALRSHSRTLCAPAPKPTEETERWWHGSWRDLAIVTGKGEHSAGQESKQRAELRG